MKFNVGGIEAETREGLVTEILKFMETEEGKKQSALWIGWGGTFTLGIGEIRFIPLINITTNEFQDPGSSICTVRKSLSTSTAWRRTRTG